MKIRWTKDKEGNVHFYNTANGFELKPIAGFVKSALREMISRQR